MPNPATNDYLAGITTTDAASHVVATITTATNNSYLVAGRVVARDVATGNTKVWWASGCFKNISGTVTQVGAIAPVVSSIGDVGTTTWTATVALSGFDIQIVVTGQAATTIDWAGYISTVETD